MITSLDMMDICEDRYECPYGTSPVFMEYYVDIKLYETQIDVSEYD